MLGTPTRDRQTERREATRLEILDAAWALARENGLSQITLRDVANQVGMRAPSLYSHFESKNAIYDAMFAQAWSEAALEMRDLARRLPSSPRSALKKLARTFFDSKWLYSDGARMPTWFATSRRVIWDSPFSRASAQAASRISSRVASRRSVCRSRVGVPNMIRIILLGPTLVKSM
jgi:AcrR family transcriptional regulator